MTEKGYLFPDPVDPGELSCFTVYVPKHSLYLGAFWSAYEFFTSWMAWARDPLKRGKDVAQVWRGAYDRARREYILSGGECMPSIVDVRISPLDPCEIEVMYEGATEWVGKANVGSCGGSCGGSSGTAIRFNGQTIQRYDPCTGEFVDAGPISNPKFDIGVSGKYTGVDCGNGVAAANLARVLEDSKNLMCTRVGALVEFSTTLLEIISAAAGIFGFWAAEPFIAFLTGAWTYLQAHYTDVAAFDLYEELSPILPAYFSDDGSMTRANYDAMLARVTALSASYGPLTPGGTANGYAQSWIDAAGIAGVVRASDAGNVATFDCATAEWEQTWDFESLSGPWSPYPNGEATAGIWDTGIGWIGNINHDVGGGNWNRSYLIRTYIPPTTITHVQADVVIQNGVWPSTPAPYFQFYVDGAGNVIDEPGETVGARYEADGTWTGATFLQIGSQCSSEHSVPLVDPGGHTICVRITVRGIGHNPWS